MNQNLYFKIKNKPIALLQKGKLLFAYLLILLTIGVNSCSKPRAEETASPVVSVKIDKEKITLLAGDEIKINPNFTPQVATPAAEYKWQVLDSKIAEFKVNADFSVNVIGKSKGETEVVLYGPSGKKIVGCLITVQEKEAKYEDDGILKILAIGNSFSEDALESYLAGLAIAKGHKIVIGNMYIGGASLSLHVQNATNNINAYAYRKINQQGIKATTANVSIATALADDDWDYISFQQESPNSGKFDTFSPLVDLYNYVKTRTKNPQVKYILHQTWAYQKNSTYSAFANYDKDQDKMYAAIVDAYTKAKALIPIDRVVPAGTAIQNGRTSIIGDNFCRDGYHLDINIGRYTAACTWFEALFNETVVGNTYKPTALSARDTEIAQNAAHFAYITPNQVTPLVNYQGGGNSDLTKAILINFGGNNATEWNTVPQYTAGTTVASLKDQVGANTNFSVTIVEGFNNRNQSGPTATTTTFNMPSSVSSDSYYGNSKAVWESKSVTQSVVKLTGLNTAKKYSFCFFGSRANSGNENRETKYTVKGTNEVIALLDAANNTANIACAEQVMPNAAGEITITITAGSNNNNSYGFYYINALQLKQVN
ncbi:DUF4886 domain-containing protein [Pedobacter xixiisoli]|uniref:Pilus formation protein N terminal region n=1 Tax=Pedobacter xixiisoli TaxID=1476464 RepID=A0A285ZQ73_9SPHI|nr:DUF4886 domain-containing protein [Pedobacter xixiisoli]SOD11775.1 Pilus formation protein N terminal region [Pedobacter xixiisoli]